MAAIVAALGGLAAHAAPHADSLLAIDQNRSEIVSSLVAKWKDHLAGGKEKQLRETLMGLRADKLLAVSLAQDQKQFAALLEKDDFLPLKPESPAQAGGQDGAGQAKALGEPNTDVVYVPVTPCRLFYTEIASGGAGGALLPGVTRTFNTRGSLTDQGGAAGCELPATATAAVVQMGAFSSFGLGWINAGPQGSPISSGVLLTYNNVAFINATSVTLKINPSNGQFSAFSNNTQTELYGDVLGYFAPPANGNGLRVFQSTDPTLGSSPNTIIGVAENVVQKTCPSLPGGLLCQISDERVVGGTVGGGGRADSFNKVTDSFGTVSGGSGNRAGDDNADPADADYATVGGGRDNTASGSYTTVGGGQTNTASGFAGTIAGGRNNTASGIYSIIAGGVANTASGTVSTVAGGQFNSASGFAGTVAGGQTNTASGFGSTVTGGQSNTASGPYSFVAGFRGVARSQGMFVWSDTRPVPFDPVAQGLFGASLSNLTLADNTFIVRATGGVDFVTGIDASTGQVTTQCYIGPGGTGWSCVSDRAQKEAIQVVRPKSILARLMKIPVSTWSIKGEKRRQMGPMAQDFYQAFGLGDTDKAINSIDAQGVAFAAIQGLNQKLVEESRAKDRQIRTLKHELAVIKKKLGM